MLRGTAAQNELDSDASPTDLVTQTQHKVDGICHLEPDDDDTFFSENNVIRNAPLTGTPVINGRLILKQEVIRLFKEKEKEIHIEKHLDESSSIIRTDAVSVQNKAPHERQNKYSEMQLDHNPLTAGSELEESTECRKLLLNEECASEKSKNGYSLKWLMKQYRR